MSQFNIAEAKSHFSEIVQKALLGEEVIIAKGNKPILKLMPLVARSDKRVPGSAKSQILQLAKDFDKTPTHFKDYV